MTQEQLKEIAQKLWKKTHPDFSELEFISDIKVEGRLSLMLLHFDSNLRVKKYKRYHMIVTDSTFTDIIWYETNVVDSDISYDDPIDTVVRRFRRDMLYWLMSIDCPKKSVFEDTETELKRREQKDNLNFEL